MNSNIFKGISTLTGPSGSGKSTYCRNIANKNPKNVFMLPQDPVYLHTSITRNITLDRPRISFDYFKAIFDILECESYIDYLTFERQSTTNKYVSLSGGQKRRIFLLRAFYKKYDNYILDESFVGIPNSIIENFLELILQTKINMLIITHDENIIKIINNNYIYE